MEWQRSGHHESTMRVYQGLFCLGMMGEHAEPCWLGQVPVTSIWTTKMMAKGFGNFQWRVWKSPRVVTQLTRKTCLRNLAARILKGCLPPEICTEKYLNDEVRMFMEARRCYWISIFWGVHTPTLLGWWTAILDVLAKHICVSDWIVGWVKTTPCTSKFEDAC